MAVTEWGDPIEVNGVRPAWLRDDAQWVSWSRRDDARGVCDAGDLNWDDRGWSAKTLEVETIRLPADHWAYQAIRKGLTPWGGGTEAPADWAPGDEVMFRGGQVFGAGKIWQWTHGHANRADDIIGYHPRVEPVTEIIEAQIQGDPLPGTEETVQPSVSDFWPKGPYMPYGTSNAIGSQTQFFCATGDPDFLKDDTRRWAIIDAATWDQTQQTVRDLTAERDAAVSGMREAAAMLSTCLKAYAVAEEQPVEETETPDEGEWVKASHGGFRHAYPELFAFGPWQSPDNLPIGAAYQWRSPDDTREVMPGVWRHDGMGDGQTWGSTKIRRAYRIGEWHNWFGSKTPGLEVGTVYHWHYLDDPKVRGPITQETADGCWSAVTSFCPIKAAPQP